MQIYCRQSIMDLRPYASSAIFNSSPSFENALRSCVSFLMQLCLAQWLEVYATNAVITHHQSMSEKALQISQPHDHEENCILLGKKTFLTSLVHYDWINYALFLRWHSYLFINFDFRDHLLNHNHQPTISSGASKKEKGGFRGNANTMEVQASTPCIAQNIKMIEMWISNLLNLPVPNPGKR